MPILQVHQAKALKMLQKGSSEPMSIMVVQECQLWPRLAELKEVDKVHFLD